MTDNRPSVCVCVTGWHFDRELYRTLRGIERLTLFVVSHRPMGAIPREVLDLVGEEHVFCLENAGYDWGAYQQFLELGIFRSYEYVFFMHDDLHILDTGFVDACIERLKSGIRFVGNGRAGSRSNWFQRVYPAVYAHAEWTPPDASFQHATVRGSFFATTRTALQQLGSFEVFWDRFHLSTSFGNWSLVASCGKAEAMFGERCFAWLSDTYLESAFIVEGQRGGYGEAGPAETEQRVKRSARLSRQVFKAYRGLCNFYVDRRLGRQHMWTRLLRPLVMLPAGRCWRQARGSSL